MERSSAFWDNDNVQMDNEYSVPKNYVDRPLPNSPSSADDFSERRNSMFPRCHSPLPPAKLYASLYTLPTGPPEVFLKGSMSNDFISPEITPEKMSDAEFSWIPLSAYKPNRITRQKRHTNMRKGMPKNVCKQNLPQNRSTVFTRHCENIENNSDDWEDAAPGRRVQFARDRSCRRNKVQNPSKMMPIRENDIRQTIKSVAAEDCKIPTILNFNQSPYKKAYSPMDYMKRRPIVQPGQESERSLIDRRLSTRIKATITDISPSSTGDRLDTSDSSNEYCLIIEANSEKVAPKNSGVLSEECGGVFVGPAMADVVEVEKENRRSSQSKSDPGSTAQESDEEEVMELPVETNSSREMKVFKRVLRDSALRRPFHAFLEQQFCAENLNFYVAVEQYHDLPHESTSRAAIENRELCARRIYERHFTPNSMEPVNVDNSTSKKIKEMITAERYVKSVFDVAQYQIFHLLKYDCWPRFLRAGGVAPEFSDEELADDDNNIQLRADSDEPSGSGQVSRFSQADDDKPSSSQTGPKTRSWAHAFSVFAGGSPNNAMSGKDKRRSLLWHGFDRFSRKLKKDGVSRSSGGAGSPVCDPRHAGVHRTSSSRAGGSHEEPRRSYSSEMDDERVCESGEPRPMHISSAGSRRRHMFSQGKQFSMPAEISHPNSPLPLRQPQKVVCKYCTLMSGDSHSSETVELNDPSISVGRWTQLMATQKGMDKKSTEAVDAQTGSTIDPCRQAIDALQNRFVRLVPVVTFAVEILPPNYSFKNPQSTPSKLVMLRARHSLSAGAALRPLLWKYSIDFSAVVVVFSGTLDSIRPTVTIGNIGPRTLTVMSQQQFQDRQTGKDAKVCVRDPIGNSPNLAADHGLQFHQHGDVSYCELPSEHEKSRGLRGDHSLGLMKFVRKASAAVTNKDDSSQPRLVGQRPQDASGSRRKSVGPSAPAAGVYCGDEQHAPPESSQGTSKKRLSIFKNNKGNKEGGSTESKTSEGKPPVPPGRSRNPSGTPSASPREANGDGPRTPAIYASKVCEEGEEGGEERSFGWQPAAYV